MKGNNVHKFYASSLEDIIGCVDMIENLCEENNGELSSALWFRGHEYTYYNLEPNIFRKAQYRYNDACLF